MAWTYGGNPAASARDAVRYLIGDTLAGSTAAQPTLSDAEVDYELGLASGASAAAAAARSLAAKFARYPSSKQVGDLSVTYGDRREALTAIAERLDRSVALAAVPVAGGISIADKDNVEDDPDRVAPGFSVGMHDHPVTTAPLPPER